MLDGGLDLGPVTGTYFSLFQKQKFVIYRQLPLVYLLKPVESLDKMFRLQDKVYEKTAMTGRQPVHVCLLK